MTKQIKTVAYLKLNNQKRYLAKMHHCAIGGAHEPMRGVLFRRCKKCGNIYSVRDEGYIKEHGELPID